jgi:hypothetical protein
LRHKAHNLKDDGKIETIATKFKKNQAIDVINHSSIEKKTSSIEQEGYGFYFEKKNQIYKLRFRDEDGTINGFGEDRDNFTQAQFDKFTKQYTGEYLPSSFPKFSREDNISTRIRKIISDNKSGICISIKDNKYFDVMIDAVLKSNCNNNLENISVSGNRQLEYYNSTVTLSNKIVSELILCNADFSNINNIYVINE